MSHLMVPSSGASDRLKARSDVDVGSEKSRHKLGFSKNESLQDVLHIKNAVPAIQLGRRECWKCKIFVCHWFFIALSQPVRKRIRQAPTISGVLGFGRSRTPAVIAVGKFDL